MTILSVLANETGSTIGQPNWWSSLDPVVTAAIVSVVLLILAAIPQTSKLAVWIAWSIVVLVLVTGKIEPSGTPGIAQSGFGGLT